MSGTEASAEEVFDARLGKLEAVLDRKAPIDSLGALISAIDPKNKRTGQLNKVAIGLDSSVFLRLCSHRKIVDILDYLGGQHSGPLILPGQAVQEFWNNQLAAVDTVASTLKKKFEALKQEANKVDKNFGNFSENIDLLLSEFSSEYGYVYDKVTLHNTLKLLEILQGKAVLPYVPRMRFHDIAIHRKRTKTPPGFKDDGDGDFYIWVDFLYGLIQAQDEGKSFEHAVIVTHDQKVDWSRAGIAHPVLVAEVKKLVGVSFEAWTIDMLYTAIEQQLSAASKSDL